MVIVLLVLVILTYIAILLGLTVWFDKYHYYKNTYFNHISLKPDDIEVDLPGANIDSQIKAIPENSRYQNAKRGVHERKSPK